MGKHFGNLQKLTGVTYYTLSPNELKAFKGILNPGIVNTIRRFRENVFYIGIPFFFTYVIYDWANKENQRLKRKNPDDYKNDV